MYTIGIYPRKSVYRDNSDSVAVQIQLCKDYAGIVFKGKEVEFRIYDKDEGFSGKNMNRPSFKELMEDVQNNMLDAVMVYKLDRISRNVQEFSSMYEIFQQHNVSFISVKESFDTSTPMGRTVMYILAAFAQLERENTSERVADNMKALGASGKWTGGKLPAGMSSIRRETGGKEHSFLVVDENTIGNVKLLYRLMLDGFTITKLERYCRDHGIRTQNGKFLSTTQIYSIISNPVYCQNDMEAYYYFQDLGCTLPDPSAFDGTKGLIGYGKTKTSTTSQKRQKASAWTISIGIHNYVIPSSDWIAVQKMLNSHKMYRTPKHNCGILKGVIRCKCGSRMDVRTYKKNGITFSYYYCQKMFRQGKEACNSGYVRTDTVDARFVSLLEEIRLAPDSFIFPEKEEPKINDTFTLRKQIRELESQIGNLTAALAGAMGTAAASYIIQQINTIDKNKKELETELRRAEIEKGNEKTREQIRAEIFGHIEYLLDNFDSLEYSVKNETIKKMLKACIFDGDNLRIIF